MEITFKYYECPKGHCGPSRLDIKRCPVCLGTIREVSQNFSSKLKKKVDYMNARWPNGIFNENFVKEDFQW